MLKRHSTSKAHVILAATAGVAAVTFTGVFMSGCGSACDCCGCPIDSGPDVTTDAKSDAGDAGRDGSSDATSDSPNDAPSDSSSDGPSDAPTG